MLCVAWWCCCCGPQSGWAQAPTVLGGYQGTAHTWGSGGELTPGRGFLSSHTPFSVCHLGWRVGRRSWSESGLVGFPAVAGPGVVFFLHPSVKGTMSMVWDCSSGGACAWNIEYVEGSVSVCTTFISVCVHVGQVLSICKCVYEGGNGSLCLCVPVHLYLGVRSGLRFHLSQNISGPSHHTPSQWLVPPAAGALVVMLG